jgi:hypothetical protein
MLRSDPTVATRSARLTLRQAAANADRLSWPQLSARVGMIREAHPEDPMILFYLAELRRRQGSFEASHALFEQLARDGYHAGRLGMLRSATTDEQKRAFFRPT